MEEDKRTNKEEELQCDQMARLFLQYLALYDNGLLPNNIKKLPK